MPRHFQLTPQAIDALDFKWNMVAGHWTYAGHDVTRDIFSRHAASVTSVPLGAVSVVHEEGDSGYLHTHVLVVWKSRVKLTGARKFDIDTGLYDANAPGGGRQLHPHFQPKLTMKAAKQLYTQYHRGLKFNTATQKVEFKEPIMLDQWSCVDFDWDRSVLHDIINAPTLMDACLAAEVMPKSVTDVKVLREASLAEPEPVKKRFPDASYKIYPEFEQQVVWGYGLSNIGKTGLFKAQARNPLQIKPFNGVDGFEMIRKEYDPTFHDAILLDEVDLSWMSRVSIIALFDEDDHMTVKCRHVSFILKKPVRIFLLSNEPPEKLLPKGCADDIAITRRFTRLPLYSPTWIQAPQPPQPFQPPRQLLGPGNTAQRQPAQRTPLAPLQTPMPPPRYGTPGV